MKSFKSFLEEKKKYFPDHVLRFYDVDETLAGHHPEHAPKVHVKDASGEHVTSLDNTEFNYHKLEPGDSYDFSEFRSSDVFSKSAHPIVPMIRHLKHMIKRGSMPYGLTARPDMDDQKKFAETFKNFGIDINKDFHVIRAGNLSGSPDQNKKQIISNMIRQGGHKEVHLYDDSQKNLESFLDLKQDHPEVSFHAHHVTHDKDGRINVNTTIA